jgi:hypothetical protein
VPWDKTESSRPQLGRYRNQTEFVVWGTNGPRPLTGPVAPGVFRQGIPRLKRHIAGKLVELMEGLLGVMRGSILDPFMGSATVGASCLRRGLPMSGSRSMRRLPMHDTRSTGRATADAAVHGGRCDPSACLANVAPSEHRDGTSATDLPPKPFEARICRLQGRALQRWKRENRHRLQTIQVDLRP